MNHLTIVNWETLHKKSQVCNFEITKCGNTQCGVFTYMLVLILHGLFPQDNKE